MRNEFLKLKDDVTSKDKIINDQAIVLETLRTNKQTLPVGGLAEYLTDSPVHAQRMVNTFPGGSRVLIAPRGAIKVSELGMMMGSLVSITSYVVPLVIVGNTLPLVIGGFIHPWATRAIVTGVVTIALKIVFAIVWTFMYNILVARALDFEELENMVKHLKEEKKNLKENLIQRDQVMDVFMSDYDHKLTAQKKCLDVKEES
ncbi:hypothetical protein Bca4012_015024 [Brassica carinata]|uniref:Uncharacterized protein n=1 Tax=Brassica carinata TaxID=52824 RepID=A0A8X7P6T9_BRACI|nr:hypothetical protein Bca52824_092992 [Brassica carinata]